MIMAVEMVRKGQTEGKHKESEQTGLGDQSAIEDDGFPEHIKSWVLKSEPRRREDK